MPFKPESGKSTFASLGNFVEDGMTFFPVGFLLSYFFPRARPAFFAAILAGCMGLAVEIGQGYAPGRYPDITDVLGDMLGGLAGGLALTRGWPAFTDYMREDEDRQV
jgi:glycopeptide antibiotics resistance protein